MIAQGSEFITLKFVQMRYVKWIQPGMIQLPAASELRSEGKPLEYLSSVSSRFAATATKSVYACLVRCNRSSLIRNVLSCIPFIASRSVKLTQDYQGNVQNDHEILLTVELRSELSNKLY